MKPIKDYAYSCLHVIQRLKERHGLEIDADTYDQMNKHLEPYIGNPNCGTDNNGEQEIHSMFVKIKIVKVVYSLSNKRITTVL